ncbi:MAG: threonylcarbamoyl-AMP synthase [Candidatus Diapherotrites archaeon]|nr:threonylcarbamoyl-AMP synthase [Candidatus Diapherotrites archaeon]
MKIMYVPSVKDFPDAVRLTALALKKNHLAVIPTETSYGLAALASSKKAVKKIHAAKKQPAAKAVSIIVPSLKVAEKYGVLGKDTKRLVEKFMPGPLTLVVPAKKTAAHLGGKSIAFRISSNKFAHALCTKLRDAITATSANIHGEPDTYSSKKAEELFFGKALVVVDAGKLPKARPSTVYEVTNGKILRRGKISEKQIKKSLKGIILT